MHTRPSLRGEEAESVRKGPDWSGNRRAAEDRELLGTDGPESVRRSGSAFACFGLPRNQAK